MNPMKRLGLAAVLMVGVMLCAVTTAQGKKGEEALYLTWLSAPAGSPEPEAYGTALYEGMLGDNPSLCDVTVNCEKLTPRQKYVVRFDTGERYSVTANRKGKLSVKCEVSPAFASIAVANAEGTLVLYGEWGLHS